MTVMACDQWFEAISASVDGEDPGVDERLLDAHLASCPGCREAHERLVSVRRRSRVQPAANIPDLSARIVKATRVTDRSGNWLIVRIVLAAVAVQVAVTAMPALLLGDEAGTSAHDARHLGAFSVAYAVGLLVVAVRPARARSILPVTMVLVAALVIGAVVDAAQGHIPLAGEMAHAPEVLGTVLVWALAVPVRQPRGDAGVDTRRPSLRLLGEHRPEPEGEKDAG